MYVCLCNAVTDARIISVLAGGARDEADVERLTGAGGTCGGCLPAVLELIERFRGAGTANGVPMPIERSAR